MKLRTSLTASRDGSLVDATDENLIHDAMAAHAQENAKVALRAEFTRAGPTGIAMIAVLDEIDSRADELMHQWGFDSGEAE